jgi:hypothetical protein
MGTRSGEAGEGVAGKASARRDFLWKAAVAGTGAFAAPMIVTVDPADAQALTSPPPEPPGAKNPASPAIDLNRPGTDAGADGSRNAGGTRRPIGASGRTELPRTGADIDRMVAAGLAATAGGAALVLWSADTQSRPAPESPSPGAADPETTT